MSMEFRNFDSKRSGELLKHMDKQNELLMEAYRSMLHQVHKLQVEEEMLMRKMYEVVSAHDLIPTKVALKQKNNDNRNANSGAEQPKKEINETSEEE